MPTIEKHVGEQMQGDKKEFPLTQCTLTIINGSSYEAENGNFIFRNAVTEQEYNLRTPGLSAGATIVVPFNWPYDEPWNAYTGLINAGDGAGFPYWCWGTDHCTHFRPTSDFPYLAVEMTN